MSPPCERCGWIHGRGNVVTIGRFTGSHTYRADHPDAPARGTLIEALMDVCDQRVRLNAALPDGTPAA